MNNNRITALSFGLAAAIIWIIFWMTVFMFINSATTDDLARVLFDYGHGDVGTFPLSMQNMMWIIFFFGIAELVVRYRASSEEIKQLNNSLLPEDERTMLVVDDLRPLYKRIRDMNLGQDLFLPRLIHRIILQFQSSQDVEPANTLLNSSLDLFGHELELRYNLIRYITWLIPTMGFIGTVVGITMALQFAGSADPQSETLLSEVTQRLAFAFNTTLVALVQAAVLVFITHLVQAREESILNNTGQYCLDNLINRLYMPESS